MKSFRSITLALLYLNLIISSCSPGHDDIYLDDSAKELNISKVIYSNIEKDIFNLVNDHRILLGISTLELADLISTVAKEHTDYMIYSGNIGHNNFAFRLQYLIENAGAKKVGENVAYSYSTAEGVMAGWLKSQEHKEVLENGSYTHFGISVKEDVNGRKYFTAIFIKK